MKGILVGIGMAAAVFVLGQSGQDQEQHEVKVPLTDFVRPLKTDADVKQDSQDKEGKVFRRVDSVEFEFNGQPAKVQFYKDDFGLSSLSGMTSLMKALDHSSDGSKPWFRLRTGSLTSDQRRALADVMDSTPGLADAILTQDVVFDVTSFDTVNMERDGKQFAIRSREPQRDALPVFVLPRKEEMTYQSPVMTIHEAVLKHSIKLTADIADGGRLTPPESIDLAAKGLNFVSNQILTTMVDYSNAFALMNRFFDSISPDAATVSGLTVGARFDDMTPEQKRVLSNCEPVHHSTSYAANFDLSGATFLSSVRGYFIHMEYVRNGRPEGVAMQLSGPKW